MKRGTLTVSILAQFVEKEKDRLRERRVEFDRRLEAGAAGFTSQGRPIRPIPRPVQARG